MLASLSARQAGRCHVTPIDFILAQFPGRTHIGVTEAGTAIGIQPRTVRNWLHQKKFPLPTSLLGGKRMVSLIDLAEFLSKTSAQQTSPLPQLQQGKKRGRPSKKELIKKRMAKEAENAQR